MKNRILKILLLSTFFTPLFLGALDFRYRAPSSEDDEPKAPKTSVKGESSEKSADAVSETASVSDLQKLYQKIVENLKNSDKHPDELTVRDLRKLESELEDILYALDSLIKKTENKLEELSEFSGSKIVQKYKGRNSSNNKETSTASTKNASTETGKKNPQKLMPVFVDGKEYDVVDGSLEVVIKDLGGASAFFATYKGKPFIFTNLHVVSNDNDLIFKTVSGVEVKNLSKGFWAKGKDVYILPINNLPENSIPLPFCENINDEVHVGDSVMVCGNGEARGVFAKTHGKVVAIGPSIIEIDCPVYPGNSGSPIYHEKSGKIIGVASHLTVRKRGTLESAINSTSTSSNKQKAIRFFAQRVDTVQDWESLPLDEIRRQIKDLETFTAKADIINIYLKKGHLVISKTPYPDFEKIVAPLIQNKKVISSAKRNALVREYLSSTIKLISHEIAMLKAKRVSAAFESYEKSLIEEFTRLKSVYEALLNAEGGK